MERCKYPGCKKQANKTWALVGLCNEHYDNIKLETLVHYGHREGAFRIPYDERSHYIKIANLIPWSRWMKL